MGEKKETKKGKIKENRKLLGILIYNKKTKSSELDAADD